MNVLSAELQIDGLRLETSSILIPGAQKSILLLHEGLGSIELWKDFPLRLSGETNCSVLSYSRLGHGRSDAAPTERDLSYLHHEAFYILPRIIEYFQLQQPVLFGHSDGASIALLYASKFSTAVDSVIAEAPHLFVEEITVEGIRQAGTRWDSALEKRLAKYHNDANALFHAWYDIWLKPEFKSWNIEAEVALITCPVLAIQGEDDQYGTLRQVERIKELTTNTELFVVTKCGHSPHQEKPDEVLQRTKEFLLNS